MTNKIIIIILAALFFVSLIFFTSWQFREKPEHLVISVADQPATALVFIAYEKGYFKENGLNVTLRRHLLGRDALNDVLQDKADLATAFDSVVVKNIYDGKDLGILTSLHNSNRYHALVSYKSQGIATTQDLIGKKIGVTFDISSEFFLNSLLAVSGINKAEVTLIDMEPQTMISALDQRSVDAVVLFSPVLQQFEEREKNENLNLIYSDTYTEESLLVGDISFIEKNNSKIIKVITSLSMAQDYYESNEKEAIGILDKWLKDYDFKSLKQVLLTLELSLGLNNTLLTHLERINDYFQSENILSGKTLRVRQNILSEYLKKVDPEKVTIY